MGIGSKELTGEELVAPPHVVPRLERAHHDGVRARGGGRALECDGERMRGECTERSPEAGTMERPPAFGSPQGGPNRGTDHLGDAVRDETTGSLAIVHEALATPFEVSEYQRARRRGACTADVDCGGVAHDPHPPASLERAVAEIGLFRVEPVAGVESTQRFE